MYNTYGNKTDSNLNYKFLFYDFRQFLQVRTVSSPFREKGADLRNWVVLHSMYIICWYMFRKVYRNVILIIYEQNLHDLGAGKWKEGAGTNWANQWSSWACFGS